jgi:hypothetical protein
MNQPQLQPVSDTELRSVEGGGIFSRIVDAVVKVVSVLSCINKVCT